ncbi:DUF1338 family protein [Salmonella enterica subsp. enterica serovar Weltevreden]|nr:DUF1338 family protein [Salmonella enterica subsp. enterica serovar Weltevreden]
MAPFFVLAAQKNFFHLASDIRHHGDVPSKLIRSQAGVPVHSTAFRPIDEASLSAAIPFACSLRYYARSSLENAALRQRAWRKSYRKVGELPRCRQLLDEYDEQGGFSAACVEEFVRETLETFAGIVRLPR